MIFIRLYWEFFKTGLFAVGGGMATLPFLQDIGESTGWYTYADLMNMLVLRPTSGFHRAHRRRRRHHHSGSADPH